MKIGLIALILGCASPILGYSQDIIPIEKVSDGFQIQISPVMDIRDSLAESLLNEFLNALMIDDFGQSVQAVLPMVHKSLKNKMQDNLTSDLLQFSFKKAHDNAKFYQLPVKITSVRESNLTGIGFQETAEKGIERKYWIAKKNGVNGMPAPVNIFFPEDGGPPKINYMGSL